jgi:NADH-quinone oxidoreductase subunit J
MAELILFYLLAFAAVAAALLVITRANPLMSALMLIVCFLATAGIFALLGSVFLAVIQILLYAGAIMVLFVFVIMLVHTEAEEFKTTVITFGKILGAAAAVYLAFVLGIAAWRPPFTEAPRVGESFTSPITLGRQLLTQYVLPFEILSVLLLIAIVGAIVLAKKKI